MAVNIKEKTKNLKSKSLALASGKGGVGKTTTSINLALYYAGNGLNVALVDADPLSDITTMLDIQQPESIYFEDNKSDSPDGYKVFPNLALFVPPAKADTDLVESYLDNLIISNGEKLATEYDLAIFDLPAGLQFEERDFFVNRMGRFIIVTNDEPSSHVSAGAFIRQVAQNATDTCFRIWHNKFAGISTDGFDPKNLPGNYNANVAPPERFDFNSLNLTDLAYIPQDPAMDLLRSSFNLPVNIKRQMQERIEMLYQERIAQVVRISNLNSRTAILVEKYILSHGNFRDVPGYIEKLGEYLANLTKADLFKVNPAEASKVDALAIFTPEQQEELARLLKIFRDDNLSNTARRLISLLERSIENEADTQRLFFTRQTKDFSKDIDRELGKLLEIVSAKHERSSTLFKNITGLLLFDFSVYKLFSSKTVCQVIEEFIPQKIAKSGAKVRDRHRQIKALIVTDAVYRKKYLKLIKTLFPVLKKQISSVGEALSVKNLLFFDDLGFLNEQIYLKLLTSFLHNALNSGLGVIVGFQYRPAAAAFAQAADSLLEDLGQQSREQKKEEHLVAV